MDVDTWTDHGSVGVTSSSGKDYNAIDPNLFLHDDTYYLNFGSFWDDLYQVKMKSTPTKTAGSSSYQIAYNASGTHSIEASFMIERDDLYYLFFSSGQCCDYDTDKPAAGDEYKVMVCVSDEPTGDFRDKDGVSCLESGGTLVLASHGDIYGPVRLQ